MLIRWCDQENLQDVIVKKTFIIFEMNMFKS